MKNRLVLKHWYLGCRQAPLECFWIAESFLDRNTSEVFALPR